MTNNQAGVKQAGLWGRERKVRGMNLGTQMSLILGMSWTHRMQVREKLHGRTQMNKNMT